MLRRAHSSPPRDRRHTRYPPSTPNSVYAPCPSHEYAHCCGCIPRRPRDISPSEGISLYRHHAAHYAHKFRAAIDYTIPEKPRQILSGGILLVFLYIVSFYNLHPSPPTTTDLSPLRKDAPQADPRSCAAERGFVSGKSEAEPDAPLPHRRCLSVAKRFQEGAGSGTTRKGESADEPLALSSGKEGRVQEGKHVTAPGMSWDGVFPTPTEPVSPESHSVRRAVFAVLVVIAWYCFQQSKDGLLVRPHPGFWRIVHGVGVAHLLLMVWLLAVSPEVGKHTLQLMFPEIKGKRRDVFAGTLVADCHINADTFYRQISSVWFASHVIGWLAKMIILRSWGFCLLYSISFEIAELSFHWVVPELRECWWDSVVVDAVLSNVSGMLLGVVLMKLLKMHQYDWLGRHPLYKKLVMRFMPFGGGYEWAFYETPRHLGLALILLLICVFTELNVFFLMAFLDIPAAHYCNPLRVIYLTLLGASAAAEHYEYTMHKRERIGHNEWLLAMILLVELMVCAKYGSERIRKAVIPPEICRCWGLSLALFGIWCSCYFTVKRESAAAGGMHSQTERRREHTGDAGRCPSGSRLGNGIKQDNKDVSSEVATADGLVQGHEGLVSEGHPRPSWWDIAKERLRRHKHRLRLLLLTVPPQACFLPLIYLTKFYYYGYGEVTRDQQLS